DSLAGEEPLEVNLDGEQFSVTMRTPGNDVELVSGYLLSEGVITSMDDIAEIDFSTGLAPDGSRNYNVAGVRLRPGVWNAAAAPARSVYTSSSCGICETAAIDAVTKPSAYPLIPLLGVGGAEPADGTGADPAERGGGIAVPSDAPHLDEDGDIVFPPLLTPARVGELPDRLREGQAVFEKTGGVHAAALFAVGDDPDAGPELLVTREDVGRHNAVDKVIG
ncbi:sulfurtransferase FdhD, partial [Burkholderia multivorans]